MEGCMGEESFQMWELNRRLEAYLARVKALEEQNELLSAELGGLRAQSGDASWRARADDELAALRALVDQRWREKHAAEVERDNLAEELEGVAGRCQQLRLARERTAEEAARSRRAVETEKCAQGWLSTQAAELERELEALRVAHEEELASLNAQAACAPRCPAPPRGPPAPAPEVEELARRLGEAWRGAVRGYQERVAHMETSLGQARERLGRAVQGAREGRLELQQLQAERSGLQERRAALEQRLEGRWQERLRATEKFQLAVEALEQEKQGLQSQIAQVLEGRQQLAHLKMSLSLEVATYRTLLEAENSRLQTPSGNSKASLGFQDPKLELHFPGTPEIRRLPVLSPTPLPSPLPNTLETPVPAFLKSQEFLQARTPALASTPIPPTPQTPCLAMNAEVRAQEAPLPLLQSQGERQQAPEPLWTEAKAGIPDSIIPGPEEPGGKQPGASAGQSPEDQVSSVPLLSPDHPSLEAKDEEPSTSRVSSIFQEKEGQIWGLVEKEATIEVKVASSLQKETWQEEGDLHVKEIQDSQGPLEKETLKNLGEEIQEPLMCLENESHETLEKENHESLRSLEEENLEILKSLEKENHELLRSLEEREVEAERPLEKEPPEVPKPLGNEDPQTLQFLEKENQESLRSSEEETLKSLEEENQELLWSLEEKDVEAEKPLEKEASELPKPVENEDPQILRSLEKENQELMMSPEGNLETVLLLGKENQELVKSLEEENLESLRAPEKKSQQPLRFQEAEDLEMWRTLAKDNQESLTSLKDENQEILRPLEKENQEPLKLLEEEDQKIVKPLEKENQEPLKLLEEEDQRITRPVENQEPLRSLEEEGQRIVSPLEKETQEPLRSLEEDQRIANTVEKENQEPLRSLEEDQQIFSSLEQETQHPLRALGEDQMTLRPLENTNSEPLTYLGKDQETVESLEKENQELFKSLKEESVESVRSLETENLKSLKTAEEEDLEILKPLEGQDPLWSLEEMNRETMKPLEKEIQETLRSGDENQETLSPLEKDNQEPLSSLDEWNLETLRSPVGAEKENQRDVEEEESLEKGENQEILSPPEKDNQEPLSSLGEWNLETLRSPVGAEKENQRDVEEEESLEKGENQEILSPPEKDNQEPLSSLGEWNLETLRSSVGAEKENQRDLEEEEILEKGENQESLRSLEEEGEEQPQSVNQPRWEDMEVKDQDLGQELPTGRDGMENEDESKLDLRKQDGKEKAAEQGELQLNSMGESWDPGNPESKEWRVLVVGASGKESTEGLQDRERQPEQVEAPDFPASQGEPEVIEPLLKDEDAVPGGDHDSLEMTLGSETARSKSAVGAEVELKQEVTEVGLEDPGHPAREKVVQPFMGEESLEAKRAQGLEGPGKSLEEADASEVMFPGPPKVSRDPMEPPRDWKKPEPTVPWGAEVFSAETPGHDGSDVPQASPSGQEEDEGAQPVLAPPCARPKEPWPPSPILEDVPGPQLQVEGNQEPSWGPEGMAEVLGNGEGKQEEFGPGEIPESLEEEGEESREESEADELGETLPDSTPLGLYLRSPASPRLDLAGEQRPSPQGEAGMEDWDPAVLTSKGLGDPPSEDEEDGEEEQGPDSDLSEDFEDLGTEASLLPGVSREVAEPLGQVPQLLEPTGWDRDGESDGFADEEESGEEEEEEEEREPGVQQWESGSSVGSLQTLSSSQRGDLLEPVAVGVNVPWDDGLRGTMADAPVTALDTESQDSAEPSGSEEESDSVPLEKEDQIPGTLETLRGVEDMGPGAEDIFSINGQAPNLEESEHMSGRVVNGLEQSKEVGNGTQAALDGNQGLPLQEEEGGARKTPWAGAPVHLGPGRFLKFTPRETDGDSLSSGED